MNKMFRKNGIRYVDVEYKKKDVEILAKHWREYAGTIPPFSSNYKGKGIVICAGGVSYFTCCWILINTLREEVKCTLPIEIWYAGNEMTQETVNALKNKNVTCYNILDYDKGASLSGYSLKPLAILYSSFKEVLYLDADNICIINPEFLFDNSEYKNCGSIFWPDFWQTDSKNLIWKIVGIEPNNMKEQESGQILINKELCWKELNLAIYFNRHRQVYYKLLLGDKDTFRFAWLALGTYFYFVAGEPSSCGYFNANGLFTGNTMVQHSPDSQMCFLHRNLIKWDITKADEKVWSVIKRFKENALEKQYINSITDEKLCYMDIRGDVEEIEFKSVLGNIEEVCLSYLSFLRASNFYRDFLIHSHIASRRKI